MPDCTTRPLEAVDHPHAPDVHRIATAYKLLVGNAPAASTACGRLCAGRIVCALEKGESDLKEQKEAVASLDRAHACSVMSKSSGCWVTTVTDVRKTSVVSFCGEAEIRFPSYRDRFSDACFLTARICSRIVTTKSKCFGWY
jgi:hypothetical protein